MPTSGCPRPDLATQKEVDVNPSSSPPPLGESVTEGTVGRWLKRVGDRVDINEPLLEIATDKVDTEIPSPVAGTLLVIHIAEEETATVGAELCVVGDPDERGDASASDSAEPHKSDDGPERIDDSGNTQYAEPVDAEPVETLPHNAAYTESHTSGRPQDEPAAAAKEPEAERHVLALPALGESVTEGTISRWLKTVGDQVEIAEPLVEISTDKVDTEIPSPAAGVLLEIKTAEDETVEVGTELCTIGTRSSATTADPNTDPVRDGPGEIAGSPPGEPRSTNGSGTPAQETSAALAAPTQRDNPGRAGAEKSPEIGATSGQRVDSGNVDGPAVDGRTQNEDAPAVVKASKLEAVTATRPASTTSRLRGTTQPFSRLRKLIARRMVESLQVSAQLTTVVEVDVTLVARLRDAAKADFLAREGVKLSFMPFFAKAATDGLKTHPSLNATINTDKGEVTYFDHENIAIAVDTTRGLFTPVIREAGELSISGLAKKIADLADRTRNNTIGPDELSGGTFTALHN